jgi:hypothetical protein
MNTTEQEMADALKAKAKAKGKQPFAGKEKRKPAKKLPVPPPKQAASAAKPGTLGKVIEGGLQALATKPSGEPIKNGKPGGDAKTVAERRQIVKDMLDPKKDGIPASLQVQNRKPLTPEQQATVDAAAAKARAYSNDQHQRDLLAAQKQSKRERAKVKTNARKERKQAEAAGKVTAMPLSGKAALRAIADKAAKTHAITKLPPKGERTRLNTAKVSTGRKSVARLKETPQGKITVLAKENPKRAGAAKRFALYKTGMAVADYIKAAVKIGASESYANADIRWDVAHGFISVR